MKDKEITNLEQEKINDIKDKLRTINILFNDIIKTSSELNLPVLDTNVSSVNILNDWVDFSISTILDNEEDIGYYGISKEQFEECQRIFNITENFSEEINKLSENIRIIGWSSSSNYC